MATAPLKTTNPERLTESLAELGRAFYARGWVLGTSGNFSGVLSRQPLRLAVTSTGLDKGGLSPEHFVVVDEGGKVLEGKGRPSAEVALHIAVAHATNAGAVLHTHSIWSTIVSELGAPAKGVWITGYEMLKGLSGIRTHEHREWLPVFENSQDCDELALRISAYLGSHPECHGFLLHRHGMYTWGADLDEAKRHVEILEFLLEVFGRVHGAAKKNLE
jgi:methylthioribulose-1-phosphate dehydratase